MIFISSSCIKTDKISDSVKTLAKEGFNAIELSGGTNYYEGLLEELLELKARYDLIYRCHNYFPPPRDHFVLNLASLNDDIYEKTLQHLSNSIRISKMLGADKFGFHAGFFMDIEVTEIGRKILKKDLYDRNAALQRFVDGFRKLQEESEGVELYLENNVLSMENFKNFNSPGILMLLNESDLMELRQIIEFGLLLDIGHLMVTAHTLNLDFQQQLNKMLPFSDYIHLSGNDGIRDSNEPFSDKQEIFKILDKHIFTGKDVTLEIYTDVDTIKKEYELLAEKLQ